MSAKKVLVLIVSGLLYAVLFGECVSGGLGPGNPISRIRSVGDVALYFVVSLFLLLPVCLAIGWAAVTAGRTVILVIVWALRTLGRKLREDLRE